MCLTLNFKSIKSIKSANQKHQISGSQNYLLRIKKNVAAIFQSENVIFLT